MLILSTRSKSMDHHNAVGTQNYGLFKSEAKRDLAEFHSCLNLRITARSKLFESNLSHMLHTYYNV